LGKTLDLSQCFIYIPQPLPTSNTHTIDRVTFLTWRKKIKVPDPQKFCLSCLLKKKATSSKPPNIPKIKQICQPKNLSEKTFDDDDDDDDDDALSENCVDHRGDQRGEREEGRGKGIGCGYYEKWNN